MSITQTFCSILVGMALLTSSAMAVPYASKIRAAETTFGKGDGTTISYILNEPADVVTVEIRDANTDAVVASFSGTTARGANSVIWNGNADNADGAAVVPGAYRIVVRAAKENAPWAEVASQRSQAALEPAAVYEQAYTGFSPNDMLFVEDTDSDFFGRSWANSCYVGAPNPTVASVEFTADLAVADGLDGLESRVMKMNPYDGQLIASPDGKTGYFWGGSLDPDSPEIFYYTGQIAPAFWTVNLADLTLENADPNGYLGSRLPRSVVVVNESGNRYAYFCISYTIQKAPMTGNQLSGVPVVIADFSKDTRYSRQVSFDSEGNLYWVSRAIGTTVSTGHGYNGRLYRWNRQTILGPSPNLTEANAAWVVDAISGGQFMNGPAISPTTGDVMVSFARGATRRSNGVYLVGNTATASINRTLSHDDRIITADDLNWVTSNVYTQIRFDPAGNLIIIDRSSEQLRAFTPGGNSEVEIKAPTSQTLTIEPPTGVDEWSLY